MRFKAVAGFKQLFCEIGKVIDLAIKHNNYGAVLIEKRLLPMRQIYYRQTTMRQPDARLNVHSALIRPPVELKLIHP